MSNLGMLGVDRFDAIVNPPEVGVLAVGSTKRIADGGATRLYDGYLLDLDGTVYLGDELLPGAFDLITRLRKLDRKRCFSSNNPTRDPAMYADKLGRLGL